MTDVLDRVRKLLRLATSSNANEAASAAAKAQELINQHQLQDALIAVDAHTDEDVDTEQIINFATKGAPLDRTNATRVQHIVVPQAGHGVSAVGCMNDVVFRFVDAAQDSSALPQDASCATKIPRPTVFVPVQVPGQGAMHMDKVKP